MPDHSNSQAHAGAMSIFRPVPGAVLAMAGVFVWLYGPAASVPGLAMVATELGTAVVLLIAAGGWGNLLVARLATKEIPPIFRAVCSCAIGLWFFSTITLLAGWFVGIPAMWVSWSLLGAGVILTILALRKTTLEPDRRRVGSRAVLWIVLGLCAGVWLAGAVRAPGTIGNENAYDVLEYHLQVPREHFTAGHIGPLRHNAYSYYPLGVEMLYLLAMSLRGGAYEGMYLAKILHGVFGVLAAGGLCAAWRKDEPQSRRGVYAGVLLASTPAVLYLGWLAFVELAMICYLTLALLWLRVWLQKASWRPAVCVGLFVGMACSVKYLSVGFIAGPVLAVMLIASLRERRRLVHWLLAALVGVAAFSPWLVRNLAETGNPVFPLATGLFGRAHWSQQSARRWRQGHSPRPHPPAPIPAGWKPFNPPENRWRQFRDHFLTNPLFGPVVLLLAAGSLGAWFIRPGPRPGRPWELALLAVLAMQVVLWLFTTRGLPWRFLVPAVAPLVLLAAGGLARLAGGNTPGRIAAGTILGIALALNLFWATAAYRRDTCLLPGLAPIPAEEITSLVPYRLAWNLPAGSRVLLVGEARAFFYPPNTAYATAFDQNALEKLAGRPLTSAQRLEVLRDRGITHILVSWAELWRLAATYGVPEPFSAGLYDRARQGRPPGLAILDALQTAGLGKMHDQYPLRLRPSSPNEWNPLRPPAHWPICTLYALPTINAK